MTYRLAEKTSLAKLTREYASCGVALLRMTKGHVFTTVSTVLTA